MSNENQKKRDIAIIGEPLVHSKLSGLYVYLNCHPYVSVSDFIASHDNAVAWNGVPNVDAVLCTEALLQELVEWRAVTNIESWLPIVGLLQRQIDASTGETSTYPPDILLFRIPKKKKNERAIFKVEDADPDEIERSDTDAFLNVNEIINAIESAAKDTATYITLLRQNQPKHKKK